MRHRHSSAWSVGAGSSSTIQSESTEAHQGQSLIDLEYSTIGLESLKPR